MPLAEIRLIAYSLLLALAGAALALWHHDAIEKGIADQKSADAAATAKLQSETAAQTAALQAQATAAEHSYDQELSDLRAYVAAHPVSLRPIDAGRPVVSATSAPSPGAKSPGPSTAGVQQVSQGDSGVQPGQPARSLGSLLDALAASADAVSDTLREAQKVLP